VKRLELGEAMSFEDVLTVITVLLLLRVLFMVPLVNIDKAKTVRAEADDYWRREVAWVLSQPEDSLMLLAVQPYRTAFELMGSKVVMNPRGDLRFIEAVAPDSSLLVVRQNPADSTFVSMRVQGPGHAKSFRRGRLLWSQGEQEWFTASDTVDYGAHVLSQGLEAQQRQYTQSVRGY
jgi:hypothetical protein